MAGKPIYAAILIGSSCLLFAGCDEIQPPSLTSSTSAASSQPKTITATAVAVTQKSDADKPTGSGAARQKKTADKGESIDAWKVWPKPQAVLVFTGEQHGYIEPCGCTGLENQKGGLARRHTLLKQIKELGWETVPMDVGNQIRRFGQQAEIKFQTTVGSLKQLGYRAIGLGPDDLRLDAGFLLSQSARDPSDSLQFTSANVSVIDPSLFPKAQVIEVGGRKIGVTAVLDPKTIEHNLSDEILVDEVVASLNTAKQQLAAADYRVLLYYGDGNADKAAIELVRKVEGFDLVVIANEFGDPIYKPEAIENSKTEYIYVGHKGMYACMIGLYENQPRRYARVPLTHEFKDSKEMIQSLATYQGQLRDVGFGGLNLTPIPHASGKKFVGSEICGECHTTAFDIWKKTPHHHATESLVHPPNTRGDIERHFDPECLSCHATGWNPQNFYPYLSGYLSLEKTPHLTGNGCENCHGPGSQHAAAEYGDIEVTDDQLEKLRKAMVLPYEKARRACLECHDLDNSPDFHEDGAFEKYWQKVKHVGKD